MNILILNPHKHSKVPTYRNLIFLNIKRFGKKPGEDVERALGEPVTQLDLKSNISSPSYCGGFETVVTRKVLFATLKELKRLIPKSHLYPELKVSIFDIFCGLLTKNAAYSFLKSAGPYRVIVTGSLTNPHVRRIFYACQRLGINSSLYITRNISPVSIPMLAGMHNATYGIPGTIFTKNMYSRWNLEKKLSRSRFHISSLSTHDDRRFSRGRERSKCTDALFILGLDKHFNNRLINFLANSPVFCDSKFNIVIRPHPLDNKEAYEGILSKYQKNIYFSYGGTLSSDLLSKRVCYLYPSESFSEILEMEISVCWMLMNYDLQAMENIFWTSICGEVVNDFSELIAHYKKSFTSMGGFSKSSQDVINVEDLRSTREPYRLLGGHLSDEHPC